MTGEAFLITGIGVLIAGLVLREVWCFLSWRRSVGGMERHEWTRLLRSLREK
jgi:hypothetical protein